MLDTDIILIATGAFLLGGFVKGVVGLGLPTVSLAILTATVGLKEAMVLMLFSSFVTNAWQALVGGHLIAILKRLWTFLAVGAVGIWIATGWLAKSDAVLLSGVFGGLLFLYGAISLFGKPLPPPGRAEIWLTPSVGGVAGIITGLTGSFTVPGIMYLQSLGMTKDVFVQAMGVVFTMSTLTLSISLAANDLVPKNLGLMSVAGLLPAALGMIAGQRIRNKLSEAQFRRVFFASLLFVGFYIAMRAFVKI
ncbi:MAG: sulfite exporter TauE/SafE family protein [Rhodospirillales bacterium]